MQIALTVTGLRELQRVGRRGACKVSVCVLKGVGLCMMVPCAHSFLTVRVAAMSLVCLGCCSVDLGVGREGSCCTGGLHTQWSLHEVLQLDWNLDDLSVQLELELH